MTPKLRSLTTMIEQTFSQWIDHDALTLAASLSYFTVLSLAPLLLIAVSIAGVFLGHDAASGAILNQLGELTGNAGADALKTMLAHAQSPETGAIAGSISFVVLLFSASGVFTQLRTALNRIWEVQPQGSSGIWNYIREQFFSYVMVIGIGFLLLVSMIISAGLTAAGKFVGNYVPTGLLQAANIVISLIVITVLFAIMYRVVPERTLPWRRLWVGSFATAALFTIGKYLLALYIGHAGVGSAYGEAGSLVVLLVWVYYSSCLFLLGAEFTRLYACQTEGARQARRPETPHAIMSKTPVRVEEAHRGKVQEDFS